MALFKKKNNEYDKAANAMNSHNSKSSDRIVFEQLDNDSQRAASLVEQMKKGNPLVIDFSRLNVKDGNKMLAFLSGAAFAIDAKTVTIHENVYMFARNIDFIDGSLDEFIKQL